MWPGPTSGRLSTGTGVEWGAVGKVSATQPGRNLTGVVQQPPSHKAGADGVHVHDHVGHAGVRCRIPAKTRPARLTPGAQRGVSLRLQDGLQIHAGATAPDPRLQEVPRHLSAQHVQYQGAKVAAAAPARSSSKPRWARPAPGACGVLAGTVRASSVPAHPASHHGLAQSQQVILQGCQIHAMSLR